MHSLASVLSETALGKIRDEVPSLDKTVTTSKETVRDGDQDSTMFGEIVTRADLAGVEPESLVNMGDACTGPVFQNIGAFKEAECKQVSIVSVAAESEAQFDYERSFAVEYCDHVKRAVIQNSSRTNSSSAYGSPRLDSGKQDKWQSNTIITPLAEDQRNQVLSDESNFIFETNQGSEASSSSNCDGTQTTFQNLSDAVGCRSENVTNLASHIPAARCSTLASDSRQDSAYSFVIIEDEVFDTESEDCSPRTSMAFDDSSDVPWQCETRHDARVFAESSHDARVFAESSHDARVFAESRLASIFVLNTINANPALTNYTSTSQQSQNCTPLHHGSELTDTKMLTEFVPLSLHGGIESCDYEQGNLSSNESETSPISVVTVQAARDSKDVALEASNKDISFAPIETTSDMKSCGCSVSTCLVFEVRDAASSCESIPPSEQLDGLFPVRRGTPLSGDCGSAEFRKNLMFESTQVTDALALSSCSGVQLALYAGIDGLECNTQDVPQVFKDDVEVPGTGVAVGSEIARLAGNTIRTEAPGTETCAPQHSKSSSACMQVAGVTNETMTVCDAVEFVPADLCRNEDITLGSSGIASGVIAVVSDDSARNGKDILASTFDKRQDKRIGDPVVLSLTDITPRFVDTQSSDSEVRPCAEGLNRTSASHEILFQQNVQRRPASLCRHYVPSAKPVVLGPVRSKSLMEGRQWSRLQETQASANHVQRQSSSLEYFLPSLDDCSFKPIDERVLCDECSSNLARQLPVLGLYVNDPRHGILFVNAFEDPKHESASVISEVINRSKENRARLLDHTNSVQNGNIEVSVEAQRQPLSLQQRHVVARAVDAFQQKAIEKPVDEQKKAVPMADLNGNLTPLQDARINRDVEILNKCIEEVENFVVLLKRINEARRQLASKRSSKKKKVHDILMLQAQPPPDEKVIEIYRKFKHSFNLLAKLRPHITAPNAPELIHYLIIPLNIIVKVTGMDKPRDVVEPLLSGVCVELLRSCLDSREYHFWQSLGPNWTLTKQSEQFKDKYIPPYAPIFSDGWVPPEIVVNEQQEAAVRSTAAMAARMKTPPADIIQESMTTVHSQPQPTSNPAYQPRLVAIVLYDYIAHNNKELTIRAGEKLDVLNNSRRWWLVKNDHGEQGYVPSTVLEIATQEVLDVAGDVPDGPVYTSANARPLEGAAPLYGKVMKNRSPTEQLSRTASSFSASGQASSRSGAPVATYAQANGVSAHPPLSAQSSYHSIAPVVISVQLPDGSQLTPRTTVDASGQQRHIVELPANIVLPQAAVESNAVARAPPAVLVKKTSVPNQGSASIPATNRMSTYAPVPPPAPPPPPVIAPTVSAIKAAAQLQRAGSTQVNGGFDSAKGDLQSELRNRLSRVDLDSQQQVANMDNVDVFIPLFKSSTADDVGRWLYKLGFSDQTIDVLKSKTAKDLFKMDKQALVDAIGHDEGIQLFEELQVQNGAQTRNKTMTEFQRALVKRLQKREEKQEQSREEHPRRFEDQANVVKLSQEEVDRVRLPSKKTEAASVRSFAIADGVSGKSKV